MNSTTLSPAVQASPVRGDDRCRILEAAIRCVNKWGVAKTSLDDIAREAGVTRQTVYSYHASRRDALQAAPAAAGHGFRAAPERSYGPVRRAAGSCCSLSNS